jgi:hypothetical protein
MEEPMPARLAYALLAAVSLAAAIATGPWYAVVFGAIAPDLALALGAGAAPGQLHPRAVPAYNAVHRFWGPAALIAVGAVVPGAVLTLGLAWGFHVALDRAVGYGLRDADGFQRAR